MSKYIKDTRTAEQIIDNMISATRTDNRQMLENHKNQQHIFKVMKDYENLAKQHDLYSLQRIANGLSDDESQRFENIYKSHQESLLNTIIKNQTNLMAKKQCWLCKMHSIDDNGETLDHFIPKNKTSGFPELAFYPNNLIPTCHRCNSVYKGSEYKDNGNSVLLYFNPYYYDVDSIQILKFVFTVKNRTVSYKYTLDTSQVPNIRLRKALENHYSDNGLKLLTRYTEKASEEIDNLKNEFIDTCNPNDFFDELKKKKIRKQNKYGINHWIVALYEELTTNVTAMNYIKGII